MFQINKVPEVSFHHYPIEINHSVAPCFNFSNPINKKMPRRTWVGNQPWTVDCTKRNGSSEFMVKTSTGLCLTVKPSRHGRGCFTTQTLPPKTMIGVYPGKITNEKSLTMKLSQCSIEQQRAVMKYLVQSKIHSTEKSCCYLDPTGVQGNIDPFFVTNPVLYINEPDSDQSVNTHHVWNYDMDRLEIWTAKTVLENQELFIQYGSSYTRDYSSSGNHSQEIQQCIFLIWNSVIWPNGTITSFGHLDLCLVFVSS